MVKALVIVESPTKARTMGKILGKNYVIKSSMGHVRDLPPRRLGVDIKNNFKPTYEIIKNKKKIVKDLTKAVKEAEQVYLATDQDREGEAIGWHLVTVTNTDRKRVKRIVFHEITKETIANSLRSPRQIDIHLVNAQQARRILDRLVGYKLSPLLSGKVRRGLSAGRVQSVALRLIVEREKQIEKFIPQEYWTILAHLSKRDEERIFTANLIAKGKKKFKKLEITNESRAKKICRDLKGKEFIVSKVTGKPKKRNPAPPFNTSSLQQEASRKFAFSANKTMVIAQQLYEGIDLGKEESVGLITYMRTDSFAVSSSAQGEAVRFIRKNFGERYLPKKPRIYKSKSKVAQEAHEAIRPTSCLRTPEAVSKYLNASQLKLYNLIWQRFVSSQMAAAIFDTMVVDIKAGDYVFRATGQKLKFPGFLRVYQEEKKEEERVLPPLDQGDSLVLRGIVPEQHFTEPPAHYTEASLIKTLEEHGIGRPSTYAPIISTLLERRYVTLKSKQFHPEETGIIVNDLLVKYFPKIMDIDFTAHMEENLDEIALGKREWVEVLKNFYQPFKETLNIAYKNMKKIKPQVTKEKCPKCGSAMVIRIGRYGKFLACSSFPRCRYTLTLDEQGNKIVTQKTKEKCPKCGSPMVIKWGRRGKFLACSAYPRCKSTRSIPKEE
ncbi:type I DNA topoisomerase [bacterium]|nr:type I DNA topoisomerase [bacterium]NIN91800.1 type I DNA topoisomerase [bacterium]NIO18086.1 type I DNA topoisomerase [bacterium]NIO73051.1 type I DNA topoisomerase [bacterium]